MTNQRKIPFEKLKESDLHLDAIYVAGRKGNIGDEPVSKMLPVGNAGGFRVSGKAPQPNVVVLFTSGEEGEWPDSIDPFTGIVRYFGDNRHPGKELHQTKNKGNEILRNAFDLRHGTEEQRANCPIFLLFEKSGEGYDVIFRGLVVPGADFLSSDDDLVAIWRSVEGQRFQNYRASFSILDVSTVSKAWLESVISGGDRELNAPLAWLEWVYRARYLTLTAPAIRTFRSKQEQLPESKQKIELIKQLHSRFTSNPYGFEKVALEIWKMCSPSHITAELTRKHRDGGRDAIGSMWIGPSTDSVGLPFVLEAKCYEPGVNSVGVKETSRIISRIRNKMFGILVTTSFVSEQAYKELRDDEHPVLIISAVDIVNIFYSKGITNQKTMDSWLKSIT
jgi:hypothetical protein